MKELVSGKWKNLGTSNKPLEGESEKKMQAVVDDFATGFVENIARFRGLEAEAVAGLEADVFLGKDARKHGLIDSVTSLEDAISEIESRYAANTSNKRTSQKAITINGGSIIMNELIKSLSSQFPEAAENMGAIVSQIVRKKDDEHKEALDSANLEAGKKHDVLKAENKTLLSEKESLSAKIASQVKSMADSIFEAKLSGSNIPEELQKDIKILVKSSDHMDAEGNLDAESFGTAVAAKTADWSKNIAATTEDLNDDDSLNINVEGGGTVDGADGLNQTDNGYGEDHIKSLMKGNNVQ